jgi:hypothetical protein
MEFQHRDIQPVIQGGHIYIATTEETLQCFREDDMQHPLWTHSTGQRLLDPILLNEDTLYVISRVEPTHSRQIHLGQASTYEIHALDTLTGRIRWHISLLTESIQRATLQGGYLFLRTEEQRLYAFATTDPQHNWSFTVHNAFFCLDPIVFRQHVYLVTNDSQTNNCTLHILKLSTGEQHLSYGSDRDPLDISYEPLVYDNFVYIVNNERDSSGKTTQKLRVFDIKHGQNIDIPQLPTDIARRPLIIHNQLYLITSGNQKQASTVHIINASTRLNEGHISLQGPARLLGYQYKGIICASPLVNGRTLYIPCHLVRTPTEKINKSCVFALDTLTQRLTLLEILDGEIIAQPILAQNKLYLTLQRKISTPGSPQNSIRYDIVIVS